VSRRLANAVAQALATIRVRDVPEVVPLGVRVDDAPVAVVVAVMMMVAVVVVVLNVVAVMVALVVLAPVAIVAVVTVVVAMAVVAMVVVTMVVVAVVMAMMNAVMVVTVVVVTVVVVAVVMVTVMMMTVVIVMVVQLVCAHFERVDAADLVAAVALVRSVRDPADGDVVAAAVHGEDGRRVVMRERHVGQEVVAAFERHLARVPEFLE
jgi:hypothetical protein